MNINSMTYQPIYAGSLQGSMAIHIEFGGSINVSVQELLIKINAVFVNQNSSVPVVSLSGADSDTTTDIEYATLVNVLKDKGVFIVVISNGTSYPSWFKLASHIVVYITNKPWLEFNANSIIYSPEDDEALQEPTIGQNNLSNNTAGYIDIKTRSKKDMLMFLKNSRFGWKVLSRKEKVARISLEDL